MPLFTTVEAAAAAAAAVTGREERGRNAIGGTEAELLWRERMSEAMGWDGERG